MTAGLQRLRRMFAPPAPTAAIVLAASHVAGATVAWTSSGPRLSGHAFAPLPEGVLVPTATAENMRDRTVVVAAVRDVLSRLPHRPRRIGMALPDAVGKVSFVPFEQVPTRAADLDRLVRWRVHKAAPFRIDDAQVGYASGSRHGEHGRTLVVTLIRRDIVEEYESVGAAVGAHAGVVDLTGFNLINAVLAASPEIEGDWWLVHVASSYSTLAIVRDRDLLFFRTRPARTVQEIEGLVHQTVMYHQDHLHGAGVSRVVLVLTAAPDDVPAGSRGALEAMLEEHVGGAVVPLAAVSGIDHDPPLAPWLVSCLAAPLGLLLRERAAAA